MSLSVHISVFLYLILKWNKVSKGVTGDEMGILKGGGVCYIVYCEERM